MSKLIHTPVLLNEVLSFVSKNTQSEGSFIDCTTGAGGHFLSILKERPLWKGVAIDRDAETVKKLEVLFKEKSLAQRVTLIEGPFSQSLKLCEGHFDFILADLGVSSMQLDQEHRGMSLKSTYAPDFRMNQSEGFQFKNWLKQQSLLDLERILEIYGEEPRAKKLAKALKEADPSIFERACDLAEFIKQTLDYKSQSRVHPATRAFQAFRIAMNDEIGELNALLSIGPNLLAQGGRLAIISFHSIEDRLVKQKFKDLAFSSSFDILTKKPLEATAKELLENSRARSAKLRVLERN